MLVKRPLIPGLRIDAVVLLDIGLSKLLEDMNEWLEDSAAECMLSYVFLS